MFYDTDSEPEIELVDDELLNETVIDDFLSPKDVTGPPITDIIPEPHPVTSERVYDIVMPKYLGKRTRRTIHVIRKSPCPKQDDSPQFWSYLQDKVTHDIISLYPHYRPNLHIYPPYVPDADEMDYSVELPPLDEAFWNYPNNLDS